MSSSPTINSRATGPRPPQRAHTDGGGVREQQQRQGRLCEDPDRLRLGLERDVTEGVIGHEDADDHEREGRPDRESVEPRRDKCVTRRPAARGSRASALKAGPRLDRGDWAGAGMSTSAPMVNVRLPTPPRGAGGDRADARPA